MSLFRLVLSREEITVHGDQQEEVEIGYIQNDLNSLYAIMESIDRASDSIVTSATKVSMEAFEEMNAGIIALIVAGIAALVLIIRKAIQYFWPKKGTGEGTSIAEAAENAEKAVENADAMSSAVSDLNHELSSAGLNVDKVVKSNSSNISFVQKDQLLIDFLEMGVYTKELVKLTNIIIPITEQLNKQMELLRKLTSVSVSDLSDVNMTYQPIMANFDGEKSLHEIVSILDKTKAEVQAGNKVLDQSAEDVIKLYKARIGRSSEAIQLLSKDKKAEAVLLDAEKEFEILSKKLDQVKGSQSEGEVTAMNQLKAFVAGMRGDIASYLKIVNHIYSETLREINYDKQLGKQFLKLEHILGKEVEDLPRIKPGFKERLSEIFSSFREKMKK